MNRYPNILAPRRSSPATPTLILAFVLCAAVSAASAAPPAVEAETGQVPFQVVPRQDQLEFFPCSQCHEVLDPDPTVRELAAPHPGDEAHGRAEFWCLVCHNPDDRDRLHTIGGRNVTFDQAYIVCGQCHQQRMHDWHFGAHGKRVSGWSEPRRVLSCPECHNPHAPAIAPRKPKPPPPPRIGFPKPQDDVPQKTPFWKRGMGEK